MTEQLKQAFEMASTLPPRDQDAIAAVMMDELKSETRWQELFDGSSDKLDKLAEKALQEHREGKTLPLDPDEI